MAGTRYRAPQPPSTALITRAGFERLRDELNDLWRVRRPEVVQALSAAAAEGDRSENAEYTYRKRQLGEIDRRVRYLTRRLDHLRVVEEPPHDLQTVYFGAWVLFESSDGTRDQHVRIVGPDETDAQLGWISIDSPMARAALKRRIDDEFEVELPAGKFSFVIVDVSYSGPIADTLTR
jgi:transcription elongation factor GreB